MALWRGKQGALSITFDDGLRCQLDHAVPALEKRGMLATFFLCGKNIDRDTEDWRRIAKSGHEIGSHSFRHLNPGKMLLEDFVQDAKDSKLLLEKTFAVKVTSYAYPYAISTEETREAIGKLYHQGRGGHGSAGEFYLNPSNVTLPLTEVRSVNTSAGNVGNIWNLAEEAMKNRSWLTLMFHGVGPDDTQFDNITNEEFGNMLDSLVAMGKLWIAPFGTVAANLRESVK